MRHFLGEEAEQFLACYSISPPTGLRVNTLKVSTAGFQAISPFQLSPLSFCPSGFVISAEPRSPPGKHPYQAAGLYYLQDPSAMSVVELLDPQPGEWVLDLAAAPGGKATHIAAKMEGQGWLLANEIHPRRAWELAENLERWGARNVTICNEFPARLAGKLGPQFDRVLVDAPCSGEGMFRKSPAARQDWSVELVRSCANRQLAILSEAARLVRPGGMLVYSTCTFAPEENELVIQRFLNGQAGFELVEAPHWTGSAPGRPDWVVEEAPLPKLARTRRFWPHLGGGEGHFVALMRRMGTGIMSRARASQPTRLPKRAFHPFLDFCQGTLNIEWPAESLALRGSYLYALPGRQPDLDGLRLIHSGWWLGTLKKERFEPSHALAMALQPGEARRSLKLRLDDERVHGYLRGDVLGIEIHEREALQPSLHAGNGWILTTVEGFPLGWGKLVKGVVKNYYPRGLRRL